MISSNSPLHNLSSIRVSREKIPPELLTAVTRTAFISRFIVLREGRRSRAHRAIEKLEWSNSTTAEELYGVIRKCFIKNGDKLMPVDRDLKRALEHARTSALFFVHQYASRLSLDFQSALIDYQKSNELLFEQEGTDAPRTGGWRI